MNRDTRSLYLLIGMCILGIAIFAIAKTFKIFDPGWTEYSIFVSIICIYGFIVRREEINRPSHERKKEILNAWLLLQAGKDVHKVWVLQAVKEIVKPAKLSEGEINALTIWILEKRDEELGEEPIAFYTFSEWLERKTAEGLKKLRIGLRLHSLD